MKLMARKNGLINQLKISEFNYKTIFYFYSTIYFILMRFIIKIL